MSLAAMARLQPGASTSRASFSLCRPIPALLRRDGAHALRQRGSLSVVCSSSRPGPGFDETAKKYAKEASGKWEQFAREQKLEQRASEAMKKAGEKATEAADQAKDKARRIYVQLDSEYDISTKTAKAARRAEEAARDIDQTYGVRRRARAARDYLARNWPAWQRQLDEHSNTWYGKAAVFGSICLVVSTPLFWQVLNMLLLLWWLSVPLSILLLDVARRQQAERLQQETAAAAAEEARRRANPFADLFKGAGAAWAGASSGGGGRGGSSGGSGGRGGSKVGRFVQQDGPVIDAEWVSLDGEEGSTGKRGGGRR